MRSVPGNRRGGALLCGSPALMLLTRPRVYCAPALDLPLAFLLFFDIEELATDVREVDKRPVRSLAGTNDEVLKTISKRVRYLQRIQIMRTFCFSRAWDAVCAISSRCESRRCSHLAASLRARSRATGIWGSSYERHWLVKTTLAFNVRATWSSGTASQNCRW